MRALCGLLILFAVPAFSASFDCAKATTAVEKTICKSPRLSALDEELARDYAQARRLAADPAALAKAQQQWLANERNGEYAGAIEAAYLARIADLRLANRQLFSRTAPPASIFGRYSHSEPLCLVVPGSDKPDCDNGEVESYIEVKRGRGNSVAVSSQLMFFNGHECNAEGNGEWTGSELRVPIEVADTRCVLLIRFANGKATTADPAGHCKDSLCGARGGYDNIELPKEQGTPRH